MQFARNPLFIIRGLQLVSNMQGGRVRMKYFAVHNAVKKSKKRGRSSKFETLPPNDVSSDVPPLADNSDNDEEVETSSSPEKSEVEKGTVLAASRGAVLQACTLTSCFIGGLGILIRQVSHFAYNEGFPILDCSSQISFRFELWHMELIAGLVLGVSSCRYILLNSWTDFAESSEAANYQVLSSLEPLDYLVVAFLPGISEEMLFRGALLPLFGINWMSVVAVATLFGVLHLGSGRKYSFTIWATLVGIAYGWATVASSSIIVPMASHALNNLIGGIIWRNTSTSTRQD
ncbi:OLC1v1028767C1 [Oldenlandia corymbosa var. corymbosa]|uniref:OLC1v1028767C1 n=1 Tax=Oldenlandia corymbosa var. corymbosa TaxID=529605 RepID=A0AAV1CF91_OLDCO|nr:OLC1v1028767C1 [Oldenlandia corymbosa var. corymbosa]